MSRNEGKIGTDGAEAVDAADILAQIQLPREPMPRPLAVARYLAAGDGWEEASSELGGAFAPVSARAKE